MRCELPSVALSGVVRVDWDLSTHTASPGEKVVASGRAEKNEGFGIWYPLYPFQVEIRLASGGEYYSYAKGMTNPDGTFSVPFAAPVLPAPAEWDVYLLAGISCGPLRLSVVGTPPSPSETYRGVDIYCTGGTCWFVYGGERYEAASLEEAERKVDGFLGRPWGRYLLYGGIGLMGVGILVALAGRK